MIPDGFNRVWTHWEFQCVYRPMAAHHHDDIMELAKRMPRDLFLFEEFINHELNRQLVTTNWDGGVEDLPEEPFLDLFETITTPPGNEENLYRSAVIATHFPSLARTSCESCQYWWWNPLTGETFTQRGVPQRRLPGSTLLCQTPQGCPRGSPEDPQDFTEENRKAFAHFEMAGGAGCPDDELTKRNWSLIKQATEDARTKRVRTDSPTHGGAMGRGSGPTAIFPRNA